MDTTPETSVIITDKIISFLSDNIWAIFFLVFIIVFREPLSNLLKRIISLDFSFGNAKGGIKATTPEPPIEKSEEIIAVEKVSEESNPEEEKLVSCQA